MTDYANLFHFMFCFSNAMPPDLKSWTKMAETYDNLTGSVSTMTMNLQCSF